MTPQQAIDLLHLGRCPAREMEGISEDHWTAWLSYRRIMRDFYDADIRWNRPQVKRRRAELRHYSKLTH